MKGHERKVLFFQKTRTFLSDPKLVSYSVCKCIQMYTFKKAITKPNPVNFDPSRYVGDMLAWLHQATASEKEHLEALLKQVTARGNLKPSRDPYGNE